MIDKNNIREDYLVADNAFDITNGGSHTKSYSISSSSITADTLTIRDNASWGNIQSDIYIEGTNGTRHNISDLFSRIETIEKRLTILRPDDKLLGKYQVLQDLYDQYKAAEALLYGEEED